MTSAAFYYDLGSPYAWLAAERIDSLFEARVRWVPVLLGAIFAATGRTSWGTDERRADGIRDVERRARTRGLPAPSWPDPWPNDGLSVMRAAVRAHRLGVGREFARNAFGVQFLEGRPLSDSSAIGEAARRTHLDVADLLQAIADPMVKRRLRDNTDGALAAGVPGVPSVVVGGEVFWGDDRLEAAADRARRVGA